MKSGTITRLPASRGVEESRSRAENTTARSSLCPTPAKCSLSDFFSTPRLLDSSTPRLRLHRVHHRAVADRDPLRRVGIGKGAERRFPDRLRQVAREELPGHGIDHRAEDLG